MLQSLIAISSLASSLIEGVVKFLPTRKKLIDKFDFKNGRQL